MGEWCQKAPSWCGDGFQGVAVRRAAQPTSSTLPANLSSTTSVPSSSSSEDSSTLGFSDRSREERPRAECTECRPPVMLRLPSLALALHVGHNTGGAPSPG